MCKRFFPVHNPGYRLWVSSCELQWIGEKLVSVNPPMKFCRPVPLFFLARLQQLFWAFPFWSRAAWGHSTLCADQGCVAYVEKSRLDICNTRCVDSRKEVLIRISGFSGSTQSEINRHFAYFLVLRWEKHCHVLKTGTLIKVILLITDNSCCCMEWSHANYTVV